MSLPFVDIAIVGGGPGGLALAQGLAKNGIQAAVFERDAVRDDYVQGFRMRIRQRGIDALRANLPAHLFEAFLGTLGLAPTDSLVLDERFDRLPDTSPRTGEPEDTHLEKSVSRITLRRILLSGLDGRHHTGKRFERYEHDADGTVVARFADGSAVRCNLLVGADGAGSAVRRQLLPGSRSIDTGVRRLAGKITLEAAARHGISPLLTEFNTNVRPRDGRPLMITSHRVDPAAFARYGLFGADDPTHRDIPGSHFSNTTSYTWWNTAYDTGELGSDAELEAAGGAELLERLLDRIAGWDPRLRALIRHTDPSTVAVLKVRSSTPGAVWPSGPVTLLGDAIHAMTYFRALGGNTALYDTGLLVPQIVAARRHGKPLTAAIHDYETAMREHGYDAVRSSLAAMRRHVGVGPALDALPPFPASRSTRAAAVRERVLPASPEPR